MTKIVIYLSIAVLVLLGLLGISTKLYLNMRADRNRVSENFEQVNQENSVLSLKYSEYKDLHTQDSHKLDSVMKANKIKPKQVVSATITNTVYKDTGSVVIVYKEPETLPDSSYSIEINYSDSCWGMKGVILTTDKSAKLEITERTANNSIQLLVTRKRFLGLLWFRKKQTFRAYSDCGEVDFSQINFE